MKVREAIPPAREDRRRGGLGQVDPGRLMDQGPLRWLDIRKRRWDSRSRWWDTPKQSRDTRRATPQAPWAVGARWPAGGGLTSGSRVAPS
jgi:hypothetical protein